jgi:hypothetical protein
MLHQHCRGSHAAALQLFALASTAAHQLLTPELHWLQWFSSRSLAAAVAISACCAVLYVGCRQATPAPAPAVNMQPYHPKKSDRSA